MALESGNLQTKLPPHNEEAELSVLGSMLCDERAAGVAVELLKPQDFYLPRHQLLFKFFSELFETQPDLDPIFVRNEMERRGLLEKVGGREIVGRLIEQTPNAANVERYARIVRETAVHRELLGAANKIIQLVQHPEEAEGEVGILDQAEELVYEIADQRSSNEPVSIESIMAHVLSEAELHIAARREGREIEKNCLPTGFDDLDRKFAGGLWPGEVCIIAARPSVGKTTLAVNIARKVAIRPAPGKVRQPVGIFSLEMPKEQVSKNILTAEVGTVAPTISSAKMRTYDFDEDEFEDVKAALRNIQSAPLFIDDTPGLNISELRARARRLCHREGVRLLIIDYLQLMQTVKRHDSREQAVAEMSRQVKQIARELKIPIIVLSQLRRPVQGNENRKPQLSDLRESGSIEQDADVVIMLHRDVDDFGIKSNETFAIVQKNRNGECGEARLTFIPDKFFFDNYYPEVGDSYGAAGD